MATMTMRGVLIVCVCLVQVNSAYAVEERDIDNLLMRIKALKEIVQSHQSVLSAHKDSLASLRADVKELANNFDVIDPNTDRKRFLVDDGGSVAFSTVLSPLVIEHAHDGDVIKFDTELIDSGGTYVTTTGVFTAPVPGIYMFTSSIFDHFLKGGHGDVLVHGEIVKNGNTLVRIYARAETGYRDQGANTVIINADLGDTFWVRVTKNDDLGLGGAKYTSFSGVLLWPW